MLKVLRIAVVFVVLVAVLLPSPLHEPVRSFLFDRKSSKVSQDCLDRIKLYENVKLNRELSAEEMETFDRDGVVVLRQIIPQEWLEVLRTLWMETVQNPSTWDIVYSRMVANFYGAQKSIFLHHSSECGRRVAQKAPTTGLSKLLFQGTRPDILPENTVRIVEPTEALLNYPTEDKGKKSGHTGWHRDDVYMSFRPVDPDGPPAAVRFWIPLVKLEPTQMRFLGLNNSISARTERAARNVSVEGTDYSVFDKMQQDPVFQSHVVDPGTYHPGDIVAFAGDTPHFAQSIDCSAGSCPRMILSFASDANAVYDNVKRSSVLPLYGGQTDGSRLKGAQFPRADPWHESDWEKPFRPSYADVMRSLVDAAVAGSSSFYGYSSVETFAYVKRVAVALLKNVWKTPTIDVKTGELVQW